MYRSIVLIALALVCTSCDTKQRTYEKYVAVVAKDTSAYMGSDATLAYESKLSFLDYVRKLQTAVAPIPLPYDVIYVWTYARLGLLAEHLGKKEEAARFFRLAIAYAKKVDQRGDTVTGEAAIRAALDKMDTPDKVPWRRQ